MGNFSLEFQKISSNNKRALSLSLPPSLSLPTMGEELVESQRVCESSIGHTFKVKNHWKDFYDFTMWSKGVL